MKITNIIYITILSTFIFTGCSNRYVEQNTKVITHEKKAINITKKPIKKVPQFTLDNNSTEFLEILDNDKYASLCSSKEKYLTIKNMENSQKKIDLLRDLFFDYTKNLSNSCINQNAFKKELKKKKYRDISQYYKVYNLNINKEKLLKKYTSNTQSVRNILEIYTPKHPQFFQLIKQLDKSKLSQSKYNKLRLNIERLKLLKYSNRNSFIQLNVPSHNFTFYEKNKMAKSFGTVVGSYEAQTPILSSQLSYFIVNPTWNIPDSIVKSSIIPKALKDKDYLKKKNIVIRKNYKLDSKKIKWKDIDWEKYLKKNVRYIPYKFIQLPSRTNGMGRMKFIFPNDYAVYMHDTIGTWRFKSSREDIRFVSHGCIRLEHPIDLMKYLSTNYTKHSYKKVRNIFDSQKTATISLSKKLPVHLTYQTVEIKNSSLLFYKDIYGYDKIQKLNF